MKRNCSVKHYQSALIISALLSCPCFAQTNSSAGQPSSAQASSEILKPATVGGSALGVGDLVEVDLFTSPSAQPEFSSKVRVGTDGTIQLPMLGGFHIAGSTLETAESDINKAYQQKG